jgi:hypothetical protein
MLQSLTRLSRHLGYEGLVLLLDEGELSTSVMRRADVRAAHNNLRHLIDSIQDNQGLFAVYAATPDFFLNPDYGVVTYGALAQRIGRPPEGPPQAYERVWNLDALDTSVADYEEAAAHIREVWLLAEPRRTEKAIGEGELRSLVRELVQIHPERARVSTWRIVTQGAVDALDRFARGLGAEAGESYARVTRTIGE